jgi:hypothetical protein
MRWRVRPFLTCCFALLVGQAFAQDELATRVKRAEEAAAANAASAAGHQWIQQHSATAARLLIPVLNQCLPESGDAPTPFSVYLRLSRKGEAREIVTDIDEELGRCMTAAATRMPFPEAPRDDYWIQLNMAAPL